MARFRSRKLYILLVLAVLAVILAFTRTLWLGALGGALVHADGPAKADIAVVLAGDQFGNRILKAGELVRDGYVPAALVSGPRYYATAESDLAIDFAAVHGCLRQWFISFPLDASSTHEESALILDELERRHTRRFLLVTSDYHTGRAGRIYRAALADRNSPMEMLVVAAPDRFFRRDAWWKSREGQKIVFTEWTKTIAMAFGK